MNSSDQGNMQGVSTDRGMQSGEQSASYNQQRAESLDEYGLEIGDDGFSFGEVRSLDRHIRATQGNRQQAAEQGERQGER